MKKWISSCKFKKLKTTKERKFHKFQNYDIQYYFLPSFYQSICESKVKVLLATFSFIM